MIFFSRYCAIDLAEHIQEVKLSPTGTLFAISKNRTAPLCTLPSNRWVVLGRLQTIAKNPRLSHTLRHCHQHGIEEEFNPIILRRR